MQAIVVPNITDAEWEVMRVIWTNQPVTSKYIIAVLEEKMDWKAATIKTLIGRLVEKGAVAAEPDGKRYLYSALVSEEKSNYERAESVFTDICNKKVGSTLAALLENATLSHEDVALLEEALRRKKAEAVEEVPCNCAEGQCDCAHHHNHEAERK